MEGKCRHYLFGWFSIQFQLFAEKYSKLNGNPSNICQKSCFPMSWWSSGRLQSQFSKVTGSNPIIFPWVSVKTLSHKNPSLPLQLHQIAKKSKTTFASLLSLNSSMELFIVPKVVDFLCWCIPFITLCQNKVNSWNSGFSEVPDLERSVTEALSVCVCLGWGEVRVFREGVFRDRFLMDRVLMDRVLRERVSG